MSVKDLRSQPGLIFIHALRASLACAFELVNGNEFRPRTSRPQPFAHQLREAERKVGQRRVAHLKNVQVEVKFFLWAKPTPVKLGGPDHKRTRPVRQPVRRGLRRREEFRKIVEAIASPTADSFLRPFCRQGCASSWWCCWSRVSAQQQVFSDLAPQLVTLLGGAAGSSGIAVEF